MYELRILTGANRGTTLPLENFPVLIGSHDDADLKLEAPEIKGYHAVLLPCHSGWILSSIAGSDVSTTSDTDREFVQIKSNECFRLAGVSMIIHVEFICDRKNTASTILHKKNTMLMDGRERLLKKHWRLLKSVFSLALSKTARNLIRISGTSKRTRAKRLVLLVFLGSAVLTTSPTSSHVESAKKFDYQKKNSKDLSLKQAETIQPIKNPASFLADEFRDQLKAAGLSKQFQLSLDEKSWEMTATLDDVESKIFENLLVHFMKNHKIEFPVHASISGINTMLPFRVRSVTSGRNTSLITEDGQRLEVGDEYQGTRILAISNRRITFLGKRKIEMLL